MPGPHVLLSSYAACVISCGTWAPVQFVTLPGLSLWFYRTWLGLSGAPPDIRRAFFYFWMHSSPWPLPRLGALGIPCYVFQWHLFPGARVGCPLLSSRALWRRLGAPPLLLGLLASLYRPNQRETIAMGDCYILCGRSGVPGPIGRRIVQQCEPFMLPQVVAWRRDRRSRSPYGSWMPLSQGCWLSVTERSVLCPLCLVCSCCRSVSSFVKNLLSSWWTAVDVALALIIVRLLLKGCCPLVPRSLPPVLCGGGAGPGLTRACSPGHITACGLETGPWALLPRSCAYHPLPSHGMATVGGFVYVSTFWNVVCIISWKYWISFLRNLSFLLR